FGLASLPLLVMTNLLQGGATSEAANETSRNLDPFVLGGVAILLVFAKLGGELFERIKQPSVLGELIAGIVLGNLPLLGFTGLEPLKDSTVIVALGEIGVIILLFQVGLESSIREMLAVGWSSLLVGVAGVIAPFFLGWGVSAFFVPQESKLS